MRGLKVAPQHLQGRRGNRGGQEDFTPLLVWEIQHIVSTVVEQPTPMCWASEREGMMRVKTYERNICGNPEDGTDCARRRQNRILEVEWTSRVQEYLLRNSISKFGFASLKK
jgi:hypothetical protein